MSAATGARRAGGYAGQLVSSSRALLCVCALSVAGCARAPEPGRAQLGVHDAPGRIAPGVAARAVDFHGTCSWGREPGRAERYGVRLRAARDPSGVILVRADPRFDAADDANVIGELPQGTVMHGHGPVHGGHGVGYAILVRGHAGRVCRGYVRASSVVVEDAAGAPRARGK